MVIKLEKGHLNESNVFVSDSKEFIFQGVNNITDRHSAPNIKINAPGKKSEDSIALNLSGLQRFLSFYYKLLNDGSSFDVSNGTHTSTVITIDEQYDYLKNVIMDGSTDIQFRLTIGTLVIITCLIDDLSLNPTFENPNHYKGSLQVTDGKNPLSVVTT